MHELKRRLAHLMKRRLAQVPGYGRSHWLWLGPDGVVALTGPAAAQQVPAAIAWAAWCAAHPGARCHLLVSSQLLSTLTAAPGLDLRSLDDVAEHARAQFAHYHGAAAQGWPVLAWQAGAASGASALSGVDLATLLAPAEAHGVRLLSLQPAWSALLRACGSTGRTAAQSLLIVDEGRVLTAVSCNAGQALQVRLRRCDAAAGSAELVAELMQELQLPATVQQQHLQVPVALLRRSWRPPPARHQFLQHGRQAPLAWAAALGSCLLAAVAGADAGAAWQRVQAAQAAQAEMNAVQQPGPAEPGLESAAAAAPTEAQAALLDSLRTPWPEAFAAAEAGTVAGVRWLGLELDGKQLRMEGQAADLSAAWQAASALARQPGVTASALSRLQNDAGVVRFEMRADWSARAAAGTAQAVAR